MKILHLITPEVWAAAKSAGTYEPESLRTEGFIHLSFPEQVAKTANRHYSDVARLLALVFDGDEFGESLVVEDTSGHGEFPHVYRAIDPLEVREVAELARVDGVWVTAVI